MLYRTFIIILFNYNNHAIIIFKHQSVSLVFNGEGEMKKIAAISLISIFLMSGCAVHNDETSIGKFGLAYKSNIQRKLDNQYYTEAEASSQGRISGAENIVKMMQPISVLLRAKNADS